jgi:SAM-dependent methyltransferase
MPTPGYQSAVARHRWRLDRPPATVGAVEDVNHPEFWSALYAEGRDGWELGRAAPPLEVYLRSPAAPPAGRAIVPGCGRGHEALLLAALGHDVVGVDVAPAALAAAAASAAAAGLAGARFLCADFFALAADPARAGGFDLLLEHTFFCAIDPSRRGEYAAAAAALLRRGATLLGLYWAHGRPGGPPWSASIEEVRDLLAPHFDLRSSSLAVGSISTRAGTEWLVTATRR